MFFGIQQRPYQHSILGEPVTKQLSCLLDALPWIAMQWQTKFYIFSMNVVLDLYICLLRQKSAGDAS